MVFFDGSEREIGKGAQAKVYAYKGAAYKVYNEEYPAQWIAFERKIQAKISRTRLPVVRYEETKDPHIIKMELIDGITLGDRMKKEKYKSGVQDLIGLQKMIHTVTDVDLPTFKECAFDHLSSVSIEPQQKKRAEQILEEIPETKNLLHLDFHFLNIMYADEKYYIIDWINARLGNPIFDYARSFVVMNEFAYRLSRKYRTLIHKDREIDSEDFNRAVYVAALLRLKESVSEKTVNLMREMEETTF